MIGNVSEFLAQPGEAMRSIHAEILGGSWLDLPEWMSFAGRGKKVFLTPIALCFRPVRVNLVAHRSQGNRRFAEQRPLK